MPLSRRSFLSLLAGVPFLGRILPAPPIYPWALSVTNPRRKGMLLGISRNTEVFWRNVHIRAHDPANDESARLLEAMVNELGRALDDNRSFLAQEVFKKNEPSARVNRRSA